MKVMSYNTLFAGFDGNNDKRFLAQVDLITGINPDILLVQEAKNFTATGYSMLFEMEKRINMRGFIAPAPHTGQNTGIFIKGDIHPASAEIDSVHFHHAVMMLKVNVPGFDKAATIISAHLCPFGPHVRLREACYLTNHAAATDLTLLAGDFNSVSAYDPDPEGLGELPSHFRARYVKPGGSEVDKSVMAQLYQAGYVDIAYHLGKHHISTVPTASFKGAEFVPFRSDYILTTQALSVYAKSYAVIKNDITDYASDHYPIIAEFYP